MDVNRTRPDREWEAPVRPRRRAGLASAILVAIGLPAAFVPPVYAQEDVVLTAYEEYVGEHPTDMERRLEYARHLLDRGRENEAMEQLESVLRDPRRERDALLHLVTLYGSSEQPQDQARAYARLLELDPERLELRRPLADLYFELRRPEDGIAQLERILQDQPGDLTLRRELANHYFWNERPEEGIAQLERILQDQPEDLTLRRKLANHYFWNERPEEGIAQLERILEDQPEDLTLRRELASRYLWSDRPGKGIAQLERILQDQPEDLTLRRELANHYFWNERPEEGIAQLERILEDRPGDVALRRELAQRYGEIDAFERAAREYRILVERGEPDLGDLRQLAEALFALDRESDAAIYLGRLVATDSTDTSARLRLAQALAWSNRADSALPHLDRILARDPDESEALLLAGELRRWQPIGWHRGKDHLQHLLARDPGHPRARELLEDLRQEYGPLVAPQVYRTSDSNGLTVLRFPIEAATWISGEWRLSLHWDHNSLSEDRARGAIRRSIYGPSAGFTRTFTEGDALHGRLGVRAFPDSRTAVTGRLEYRRPLSEIASVSVSAARRPVYGSALAIDRRLLERRLAADGYLRPTEGFEVWGTASYTSLTDDNWGLTGTLGGRMIARAAGPSVAVFGSYTYQDMERIYPDSRPYWTPDDLSTLAAGIEVEGSPVPWAEIDLRLGLSRQDRISQTYDLTIRFDPGSHHSLELGFRRLGSDVYSSSDLTLQYSHRLDFLDLP